MTFFEEKNVKIRQRVNFQFNSWFISKNKLSYKSTLSSLKIYVYIFMYLDIKRKKGCKLLSYFIKWS